MAASRERLLPLALLAAILLAAVIVVPRACSPEIEGTFTPSPPPSTARETGGAEEALVTAYVGATLLDGTGAPPVVNATVLVEGTRVAAAGTAVDIPEGADVVDLTGQWIVPGLIDAHIHFMTSGRMYTRPAFFDLTDKVPYEEEVEWIQRHVPDTLRALMCFGVTSALSLGGPSLEYDARALAASTHDAPTVFIGHGVIAHAPRFVAERTIPPWDGELTIKPTMSEEQGAAYVREAVALHADLVKTAVDDRGSFLLSNILRFANWRKLEGAIIDEAKKHGLRVTTHAHALEYARGMIELGAASLQHIPADQPVDEEFIALARERGVIVVPTLALRKRTFVELVTGNIDLLEIEQTCAVPGVVSSWNEDIPAEAQDMAAVWAQQGEVARANAKALYDGGVLLAVATDAGMIGLAHGPSMHLELQAMHEAGIPADYLLRAATLHSAMVAGKEGDFGTLEAGKFADFLILEADPLEDIGNLQRIDRVVKYGRVFPQAELTPTLPAAN